MPLRSLSFAAAVLLAGCHSEVAADPQPMDDAAFEAALRRVLNNHPELVVEAIEAHRARFEAEAEAASRSAVQELLPALIAGDSGHAVGASAEDASVVIVEFFDYHCGFCRRAADDVLGKLEARGDLRLVLQELPILREESESAARAAIAVSLFAQDDYLPFHRALMEADGLLTEKAISKAAKRAGVAGSVLDEISGAGSARINRQLEASKKTARTLGVAGTPFFVVANPATGSFEIIEGYRADFLDAAIAQVAAG